MSRRAVVLAGGKGSRLGPYTTVLPKPLLPIGDRAILDVVVHQLASQNFQDITLAVGYLAHLVKAVFADGADRGVSITYHEEKVPLGTAGALGTVEGLDEPFLVMNGDVMTGLDYDELYRAHVESGNDLTIATHRRVVHIDYGVLRVATGGEVEGLTTPVVAYEEKPEMAYTVSMGVYVASPSVLEYIGADERLDVPDLVRRLLGDDRRVGSFLYEGFWLDIGRHEDYERAIAEYESHKSLLYPTVNGEGPAQGARSGPRAV